MTYNPDAPHVDHTPVDDDPFASAGAATLRPREYYGQLSIDAWFCKLVRGKGKVPWDKLADSIDDRVTALTVELQPLAASGLAFTLKREMIAESVEWVKICWPSLRACGVQSVKAANGIWVKLVQEPTGRKYRRGSDGQEMEATTFKILEVYPDGAACEAAFGSGRGGPADTVEEALAGVDFDGAGRPGGARPQPQPQPQQATMPVDKGRQRETARQFLLAIARQKQGDLEAIKAAVAGMTVITQAFDLESDEFLAVVAEAV